VQRKTPQLSTSELNDLCTLHFWDYELSFDWEITVCWRGEYSYREAKELIKDIAERTENTVDPSAPGSSVLSIRDLLHQIAGFFGEFSFFSKIIFFVLTYKSPHNHA